MTRVAALLLLLVQQVTGQDLDKILERADTLLDEAKASYEKARATGSIPGFLDAAFKLEEARIKYLVLQEIGAGDKQRIAADRLRAVNQLTKLIHDGRVAIGGKSEPAKPAEAPPGEPPAKPPPPPRPAADVTRRLPVPDAAKQREAEKSIRDVFQEQYAKKTPADRKALARFLLGQAAKTNDDPASLWVLYREAQDAATQAFDVRLTTEAIETAARYFDVDALSLKNTAFMAMSKAAKTAEESAAVTSGLLALVDELIGADHYDLADKAATAALQAARKANDPAQLGRATVRLKEVTEARGLYQAIKNSLETIARNPDDPRANLEMGQFFCFVKGNWDMGLRFLSKGSDGALKSVAEKELSFPDQAAERAALADGWSDLAEKEKSPLKKGQLLSHARFLYESALQGSSGLTRSKIEKRLGELGRGPAAAPSGGAAIDLLEIIDPARDAVSGKWSFDGKTLVTPVDEFARLQVPVPVPEEYDVEIVAQRTGAKPENLMFGLVGGGAQFMILLDGFAGTKCGIGMIDGKNYDVNETTRRGAPVLSSDNPSTIRCSVRKNRVTVSVDGKPLLDWKADYSRVSVRNVWAVRDKKAIFIGCYNTAYRLTRMTLQPMGGR